jgi:lipid-binding SYLF domain-containing protein
MSKQRSIFPVALALALMIGSAGFGFSKESATDERDRAVKAADVLNEVMQQSDNGIPNDLMERAHAVAVFPHVVKGAFGIGGEYGKGIVSERMANGRWSAPSFLKIGGGSFGFQIGASSTDLVLIFTDKEGFKGLLDGKVKLGADAAVAAGPVGRNAQVSSDVLLKSPVFAYSRSKGLFAGIALDGAVVSIDDSANTKAYGGEHAAKDILLNGAVHPNEVVMPYVQALDKWSPMRKHTD